MTDEIQSFQGACLHRDRRGEGRNIVYPVTVWVVGVDNSIVALAESADHASTDGGSNEDSQVCMSSM